MNQNKLNLEYNITTFEQLDACCKELKSRLKSPAFLLLTGNLGSGKTTFVSHFLKQFSPEISVSSPTYSIVNEYEANDLLFLHYDLYRLNSIEEAYNIGIEDYFDRGDFHFIEWPELVEDILPENVFKLQFKADEVERILMVSQK